MFGKSINLDKAAVYGAATLASRTFDKISSIILKVASLKLTLVTPGGVASTLIERSTKILSKKTVYTTSLSNQQIILLQPYEDGNAMANDNNLFVESQLLETPPLITWISSCRS